MKYTYEFKRKEGVTPEQIRAASGNTIANSLANAKVIRVEVESDSDEDRAESAKIAIAKMNETFFARYFSFVFGREHPLAEEEERKVVVIRRTARDGDHLSLYGKTTYPQWARKAFPILVRQAQARQKITYGELNKEIKSGTSQLGSTLGIIDFAIGELSEDWYGDKDKIPRINGIVVSKNRGIPGKGKPGYNVSDPKVRKEMIEKDGLFDKIFNYPDWPLVLENFGLKPVDTLSVAVEETARMRGYGSGGESKEHKELKERIAEHPELVKLKGFDKGDTEHVFPSMDAIDVYFSNSKNVVGVEVKSIKSNNDDIIRGLFQCKKYEALIEAEDKVNGIRRDIRVILALGGEFPSELLPHKNVLSVNVIDNIR